MNDIVNITQPNIIFTGFDSLMAQAQDVAAEIRSLCADTDHGIDPEGIKEAKKMLADARKITDGMNVRRIAIKKEVLKPYEAFEAQVKQIAKVIDDADNDLRTQVRAYEEAEREDKRQKLAVIFESHLHWYVDVQNIIKDAFERWLEPKHLNKSTSIDKAEKDMAAWIQKRQDDIDAIRLSGHTDMLYEYGRSLDLAATIAKWNAEQTRKAEIAKAMEKSAEPAEPVAIIAITGKAQIELAKRLLTEAGINYTFR